MEDFKWSEGRVVLTINAKNRQEAESALKLMIDHINKNHEPDDVIEGRVTVPNEGKQK